MAIEHGHSSEEIRIRLSGRPSQGYLRDFVYGGIDGAVTTFAIVAGIEGAGLSHRVIVILGIASVLADGFSMAASNYTGTKAEVDNFRRLKEIEHRHIREHPEGEREEVRQILQAKGLEGEVLTLATESITANEENWVDLMLVDEYGLPPTPPDPIPSALATFFAFLICGTIPLIPFLLGSEGAFNQAMLATGTVFFAIGALKSRWATMTWLRSGLETLAIGVVAAYIAYGVGHLVQMLS